MAQSQKSAYFKALKEQGVTFTKHYREYSTEEFAGAWNILREGKPELPEFPDGAGPSELVPPKQDEAAELRRQLEETSALLAKMTAFVAVQQEQLAHPLQTAPPAPTSPAAQAAPAVKENVHGLDLDKFAGITQNTHGPNDIVKIDEHGNQWLQVEVRKADGLKPRGRRRLRFDNPAVTVSEIRGEDGTMESFEIPDTSKPTTPSEVRITLPSFQTGIYRSPSFPFRIHTYNGARGFDLEDVQNYYGGKDLVPSSVKKMYVYTDLCYDIPSVVSTIREEHARLVLNNSSKEVLR